MFTVPNFIFSKSTELILEFFDRLILILNSLISHKNRLLFKQKNKAVDKYTRDIGKGNLYKEELYIIPENDTLEVLGSYIHPILLIVNDIENDGIKEVNKTFINSILKQLPSNEQINIENIGVLNLKKRPTSMIQLQQKFKPEIIFTWGATAQLVGMNKTLLSPLYLGDVKLINCPEIDLVKEEKSHKAQLWQSMKSLFDL